MCVHYCTTSTNTWEKQLNYAVCEGKSRSCVCARVGVRSSFFLWVYFRDVFSCLAATIIAAATASAATDDMAILRQKCVNAAVERVLIHKSSYSRSCSMHASLLTLSFPSSYYDWSYLIRIFRCTDKKRSAFHSVAETKQIFPLVPAPRTCHAQRPNRHAFLPSASVRKDENARIQGSSSHECWTPARFSSTIERKVFAAGSKRRVNYNSSQ